MWLKTLWLVIRLFFTFSPLWAKSPILKNMCGLQRSRSMRLAVPISARHSEEFLGKSVETFLKLGCPSQLSGWKNSGICLQTLWWSVRDPLWDSLLQHNIQRFFTESTSTQFGFSNLDKCFFGGKCYGRHMCQLCHRVSSHLTWLVID